MFSKVWEMNQREEPAELLRPNYPTLGSAADNCKYVS